MKKKSVCIIIILSIVICLFNNSAVYSANKNLIIQTGKFSIYENTRLSVIEKKLGKAKLITDSMYGGKAYSFYKGDYKNYVYLESDSNGKWICGGAIGHSFKTRSYKMGKKNDFIVRDGATLFDSDDCIVYGACEYYLSYGEFDKAKKRYFNDVSCWIGFTKQSAEALNAINKYLGNSDRIKVDESDLSICYQIYKKNKTLISDYLESIGKESYYSLISISNMSHFKAFMCTFDISDEATNYDYPTSFTVPVFSYQMVGKDMWREVAYLNPDFLENWHKVEYTEIEKKLYDNAHKYYDEMKSYYSKVDSYYDIEPDISKLPIQPGKINEDFLKGATSYLNMIRAGADLEPYIYDADLCKNAQDKAALVMYCNANGLPSGHDFPKPDGVSDELYNSAMTDSGENLFMCGMLGGTADRSIYYAIDDTYGDPEYFGHRYALLARGQSTFGIGEVEGQGCQKFGYADIPTEYNNLTDTLVNAWPAKGISVAEVVGENPVWSINTYYNVTADTVVSVTLLNTGENWTFGENYGVSQVDNYAYHNHMILFQCAGMLISKGNVFDVKISGLKDSYGNDTSYNYRSVIESMIESSDKNIELEKIKIKNKASKILVGETRQLDYELIPKNTSSINVVWESSNKSVATIDNFGIVTAKKSGTTVITVKSRNSEVSETYTLKVSPGPGKTSIKKIKQKNKSVTLKWKKCTNVSGYAIEYSKYSNMENTKTVFVSKNTNSKTIILKKGKYYFRVISYKNNNKQKVFGQPSKKKSINVK